MKKKEAMRTPTIHDMKNIHTGECEYIYLLVDTPPELESS